MYRFLLLGLVAMSFVFTAALEAGSYKSKDKDKVMMKDKQSIVAIASSNESFSTLVTALAAADLVEALEGEGPFTVFAPTNDAFAALPEGTLESLLLPENKEQLQKILLYHVLGAKVMAADVTTSQPEMLSGDMASIEAMGGAVMIDGANVTQADIEASNGVIHVIDKVIIPQ